MIILFTFLKMLIILYLQPIYVKMAIWSTNKSRWICSNHNWYCFQFISERKFKSSALHCGIYYPLRPIHIPIEWSKALPNGIVGPSRRIGSVASGRSWKLSKCQRRRHPIRSPYANTLAQTLANRIHATPKKRTWLAAITMKVASAQSFRHALHQALTPTPRVNVPLQCAQGLCTFWQSLWLSGHSTYTKCSHYI